MERPFNEDQVILALDTWTLYTNTGTWSSIIGRSLIAPYRFKNCDNLQIPYISYQVHCEKWAQSGNEESQLIGIIVLYILVTRYWNNVLDIIEIVCLYYTTYHYYTNKRYCNVRHHKLLLF